MWRVPFGLMPVTAATAVMITARRSHASQLISTSIHVDSNDQGLTVYLWRNRIGSALVTVLATNCWPHRSSTRLNTPASVFAAAFRAYRNTSRMLNAQCPISLPARRATDED